MKKKNFLMGLYVAVIYGIVIFSMTSCNVEQTKTATQVINHSDKDIIIETLHEGSLNSGIYKVSVDTSQYIIAINHYDAIAITKHN